MIKKRMFCLNLHVHRKVIKALHIGRITQRTPGENLIAVKMYEEINRLLRKAGISYIYPYSPLMPEGTVDEMLVGKTERISLVHRMFYFDFKATLLNKEDKHRLLDILRESEYFTWIDYND